ncbi:DUF6882 domain-containing protein [Mesorhizobium sp. AR07]|uniref:DUF6882 domain-containing protein n=1 Tax=Mesorhizobium sp. AR07 TaxID=2865838 RepID=UPI00215E9F1C|nr:DUF6882 domain-containing protein [Mesorhizobium sp. AR07]
MKPDWYPAWRDEAIAQLNAKNCRLQKEFRLGSWSRYDYDMTTGRLLFSKDGAVKVIAGIQIAGSTSAKADNWLVGLGKFKFSRRSSQRRKAGSILRREEQH